MNNAKTLLGVLMLALLGGCNSIGAVDTNLTYPQVSCEGQVSNARASAATKALFKGLLRLSCGAQPGVLSGQNAGHGDQINDQNSIMGYAQSVQGVIDRTGKVPAILGLDYEHDRIYSPSQLSSANATLIAHAKAGGIVTINWAPLSPWVNDASDLINHPGDWLETRTELNNPDGKARYINLSELLTEGQPANRVWRQRLDGVADALGQLQAAGVPVLWRPLQEMGGTHFWWGANVPLEDGAGYRALWRDMYRYLTEAKQLNNLLWVYSPEAAERPGRGVFWAYPGDDVVDVLAPTAYSLSLELPSYSTFVIKARATSKPLALAEYGPPVWGEGYEPVLPDSPLSFDARRYARLLKDYPEVAYWVSWHSYYADDRRVTRLSLSASDHTPELFATRGILNRADTGFLRP